METSKEKLTIYTDGGCSVHSTCCAGWAVIISNGVEFGGHLPQSTNNRAELTAVLEALIWCRENNETATIWCDSQYVVKGLNQWAKKWCMNNWTKKASLVNKDIWIVLYPLFLESGCNVQWIKGHSGVEGNERADSLATECMVGRMSIDNRVGG